MRALLILFFVVTFSSHLWGQGEASFLYKIEQIEQELAQIKAKEAELLAAIENYKLKRIQQTISDKALPAIQAGEQVIEHSALSLVYSEKHEQAKWVAHIITPDILKSNLGRTNDFREDPKVTTGTATEIDYFLKELQPDSTYEYDGFGYDRGHLAPSADFRWSAKAMSDSYYYSNMSPQLADFNRGKWSHLESLLRGYISRNSDTELLVVTGPILKDGLPVIERSTNRLTIPELFYKVVVDLKNERAIGFIMPNKKINYPLASFAVSIDKVEEETGLDFFAKLPLELQETLESQKDIKWWVPEKQMTDVEPVYPPSLPPNHFNTVQARQYINHSKPIHVCGTVVSAFTSRKGNVLINLDQAYPNQIFTIFVKKDQLVNFSYDVSKELLGMPICVKGKVTNFSGNPAMFVDSEKDIVIELSK